MPSIARFSIDSLNGFLTYTDCSARSDVSALMILYGDNGSGKTSILSLIFNLLSPHPGKSHLTNIAAVPFKSLRVELSDGTVVSAIRDGGIDSVPIEFSITRPGAKRVVYAFVPAPQRDAYFQEQIQRELLKRSKDTPKDWKPKLTERLKVVSGRQYSFALPSNDSAHERYVSALRSLGITTYFIPTDRSTRSDAIDGRPPSAHYEGSKDESEVISRARGVLLRDALAVAARNITKQVIRAANAGSKDTNDIFAELVTKIAQGKDETQESESDSSVLGGLRALDQEYRRFSRLGIVPELNVAKLIPIIESSEPDQKSTIARILRPYMDSLSARLRALEPVGDSIETFLELLNGLLRFKSVTFTPANGFQFFNPNQQAIGPGQLSSGEQQLLLMFCYLLAAKESDSIFIVDEPEISLNVKWQRMLLEYMRKIVRGANCQIIIATHSMELLAQYDDLVVALDPVLSLAGTKSNDAATADD